jgi:uncharacterized protein (DUF427 family)
MFHRRPVPDTPKPGQVSVWSFPRPAIASAAGAHLKVVFGGGVIAETRRGVMTLETSHPPTYYFPRADVAPHALSPGAGASLCEWKGAARYFDVHGGGRIAASAAWSYAAPSDAFLILKDHVAFYPGRMDACFVDGERAVPQPGDFYGGWITSGYAGPFKGVPGSLGW